MTIEIINHTNEPAKIDNYDTNRYVDSEYMEREWAHVWRKTWLLAGLESDLKRPGDYFVFDMGREQILVTRTRRRLNRPNLWLMTFSRALLLLSIPVVLLSNFCLEI